MAVSFFIPIFRRALAAALLGLSLAGAGAQAQDQPLRIGVIPSVANEATEQAIAEARQQGLDVKLVEFSDWVLPNIAVADGSVDANFFQHEPFLQLFNQRRGTKLQPVAYGYSTTIGLFSKSSRRATRFRRARPSPCPTTPSTRAARCCCCAPWA